MCSLDSFSGFSLSQKQIHTSQAGLQDVQCGFLLPLQSCYIIFSLASSSGLTSISQIPQVFSDTTAFALLVFFAHKTLTSTFCTASSFLFCRSQLKCHLPREIFLDHSKHTYIVHSYSLLHPLFTVLNMISIWLIRLSIISCLQMYILCRWECVLFIMYLWDLIQYLAQDKFSINIYEEINEDFFFLGFLGATLPWFSCYDSPIPISSFILLWPPALVCSGCHDKTSTGLNNKSIFLQFQRLKV